MSDNLCYSLASAPAICRYLYERIMSSEWLEKFFRRLIEAKTQYSPLEVLGSHAAYMFFLREGAEFRILSKGGYIDPSFFYSFLDEKPDILSPVLRDGYLQLSSEEASQGACDLWVVVDRTDQPGYLLIVELPPGAGFIGPFLRLILSYELQHRQSPRAFNKPVGMDLPIWLEDVLDEFLERASPILVVSEIGSGKEELIQAFLKKNTGLWKLLLFSIRDGFHRLCNYASCLETPLVFVWE